MSSLLRRIAQSPVPTPARTRYFLAIADLSGGDQSASASTVVIPDSESNGTESLITETVFNNNYLSGAGSRDSISSGQLLRDLGREINVVNAAGARLYKYRQVQIVNGPDTAGVGGDATTSAPNPWESNLFVRVWAADGTLVNVVRTG
jgi:hypothetical protein